VRDGDRWREHLSRARASFLGRIKEGVVMDTRGPCRVTPYLSPDAHPQEYAGVRRN
jgi:hypothetical protein